MASTETIIKQNTDVSGSLIKILQEVQAAHGWLPEKELVKISRMTGAPLSEIYAIVTFYTQFHLKKRGRHTVTVCRGAACHVKGGKDVQKAIETSLGTIEGETTEDMRFTLDTVSCLGACFAAPVMIVDKEIFGKLTPEKAVAILKKYR